MLKFKLWKAVAWMVLVVAGAQSSEAATYTLADLLVEGASFVNGDKVFYDFHNYTETGNIAPLGAENIYLSTISQPNRNLNGLPYPADWTMPSGYSPEYCPTEYGFRLSADIDLVALQTYNLGLDFKVGVLDSNCWMYANELELTGNVRSGEIDISENVTSGLTTLAVKGVWIHDPGADSTVDREYFTSSVSGLPMLVQEAEVSLGLQLKTLAGGQASFEHTDIYFAQSGVPEPSTYALLLMGSAGVGLVVRRKRS